MKSLLLFVILFCEGLRLGAEPLPVAKPEEAGFSSARLEQLHAVMQSFTDEGKHAGLVTLIARDGRIVDWRAYGYRDLEKKLPMEKDSIFAVYSMTKLVTAVAVLQLIEDGRLGLDDPIGNYLPQLKQVKVLAGGTADAPELVPVKQPVTIRHLLSHTSGYTYAILSQGTLQELYQHQKLWEATSLTDFVQRAAALPLKHQPGTEFTYGISSDILGYVVEVVSGQPFDVYVQQHILAPLDMEDTSFRVPPEKRARLALLYTTGTDGKLHRTDPILGGSPDAPFPSGGRGLFSTAGDYARFAQMLLNGGQLDGRRILSRKMVEAMQVNQLAGLAKPCNEFREAYGYGLGVEMRTTMSKGDLPGSVGQFGWYGIATTHCDIDPHEHTVTLVLTQHLPFDQHGLFSKFNALFYSSLD
ncbi:serine hydrolase domain-containing protein [Chthoniobacter flavus]|nr:serine hydrolase domain-containing protein [Chthoniobacter flavus]